MLVRVKLSAIGNPPTHDLTSMFILVMPILFLLENTRTHRCTCRRMHRRTYTHKHNLWSFKKLKQMIKKIVFLFCHWRFEVIVIYRDNVRDRIEIITTCQVLCLSPRSLNGVCSYLKGVSGKTHCQWWDALWPNVEGQLEYFMKLPARTHIDTRNTHRHTLMHTYIYIYIYLYTQTSILTHQTPQTQARGPFPPFT